MVMIVMADLGDNPFKNGELLKVNLSSMTATYRDLPGLGGESFDIKIRKGQYASKGSIIIPTKSKCLIEVTKVYKIGWWKRVKLKLGLKVKLFQCKIISGEISTSL